MLGRTSLSRSAAIVCVAFGTTGTACVAGASGAGLAIAVKVSAQVSSADPDGGGPATGLIWANIVAPVSAVPALDAVPLWAAEPPDVCVAVELLVVSWATTVPVVCVVAVVDAVAVDD
jgi:hypothetical protein